MADLPIWDAFQGAIDRNVQRGSANMQQLGALQGILAQQQQQQAKQAALAKEEKLRGVLSQLPPDATPDQVVAAIRPFASADDIMKITQASADRKAASANTKEVALARLAQTAAQGEQMFQLRMQAARTAQDRQRVDSEYKMWKSGVERERLKYDTGATLPPFAPSLLSGGETAPQRDPMALPVSQPTTDERAAMAQLRPLAQGGGSVEVVPQAAPASAPMAPAPQPEQAASPTFPSFSGYIPPQNPDTELRRFSGGAPAATAPAAPAAPAAAASAAPVMPQFTGSPRQRADMENKWRLAQSKGGEAGGKASDATVTAVLEGRMQPPTGFALRSPYWQDVMERVNAKDPKFEGGKYASRAAAMRTFASGPEARNVTALNTVIGHLGTLDEAANALQNGDIRAFNAVANRLSTEMGRPEVQNFDTARQAVAEETMRVFRQVGASEREAREWGDRIQSSGSPQQLRGVIATLGKLLDSRVEAIGQQYERTVNTKGNPARVDPTNRGVLDKLIEQGSAPSWDNTKEQRYQELLRKRGGS